MVIIIVTKYHNFKHKKLFSNTELDIQKVNSLIKHNTVYTNDNKKYTIIYN